MNAIPKSEISIETSRSGGPGGQHVNTTSSRVTVRWNVMQSSALSDDQKQRVLSKLKTRINSAGDLVLHVDTFRSQIMNRERAYERLEELVEAALLVQKRRVKTKATKGSQIRRLDAKKRASQQKQLRKAEW